MATMIVADSTAPVCTLYISFIILPRCSFKEHAFGKWSVPEKRQ